jgi:hypothetical protein
MLSGANKMLTNDRSAIAEHKCPKCDSHRVRRANRRGRLDAVIALANFYPYRCHERGCKFRFYNFGRV